MNDKPSKTLSIYRTSEGIVLARRNEFGTTFKNVFETTEGLLEQLDTYKQSDKLDEYQLDVSEDLWGLVLNHLNK